MTLSHPWLLGGLLLVVPYAWLRGRLLRTAVLPYAPLQYSNGSQARAWLLRAQVPFEMLLLAGVVLALAWPHRESEVELIGEEGLDVALTLDVSASMQAADFPPNRLESLKRLAMDFVDRSMGDRIAVYAFAGHAFTQTALTTDHATLTQLIEGLSYESIDHGESGGTALGDALLAAANGLLEGRIEGRDQVLVLLTDGQSDRGIDPILASRFVAESDIRLHVIGSAATNPWRSRCTASPSLHRAVVSSLRGWTTRSSWRSWRPRVVATRARATSMC